MKSKLFLTMVTAGTLLFVPKENFGQTAPELGTAASFVLFTSAGDVKDVTTSHITGNVGTATGSSTGFGNIDGVMHDKDGAAMQCKADLQIAYNSLNDAIPNKPAPAPSLGGDTLTAGVYSIGSAATLTGSLTLDAKQNPDAVFIFKIGGAFSTAAGSKIKLINGALACNVFWKVEGLMKMASGSTMRGTIIVNNGAIEMATGDTLEGRALTIVGAVTVDGILANTPVGCGSPMLTGPKAPPLGVAACYGLFSANGDVSNTGITNVTGDVGSNTSDATGFDKARVNGTIHPGNDLSTQQCALDLKTAYDSLNKMTADIELLYPATFGHNLVLTPHTYIMKSAAHLTDSIYLNAQGNPDAVFVILINGAFTTSVYSRVNLMNGAQAKNVYWKIEGAVTINNYSVFAGTIVCNNGAVGALNTGVKINGRALTTIGAINTTAMDVVNNAIPASCKIVTGLVSQDANTAVTIYPNPFSASTTIVITDASELNSAELEIYNILGDVVIRSIITKQSTTLNTSDLPSGIYVYKIISNHKTIQSGRLVSKQ